MPAKARIRARQGMPFRSRRPPTGHRSRRLRGRGLDGHLRPQAASLGNPGVAARDGIRPVPVLLAGNSRWKGATSSPRRTEKPLSDSASAGPSTDTPTPARRVAKWPDFIPLPHQFGQLHPNRSSGFIQRRFAHARSRAVRSRASALSARMDSLRSGGSAVSVPTRFPRLRRRSSALG